MFEKKKVTGKMLRRLSLGFIIIALLGYLGFIKYLDWFSRPPCDEMVTFNPLPCRLSSLSYWKFLLSNEVE